MRLTQATNHAVKILIYCAASPEGPNRVSDVAASFDIPEAHAFKILKVLVDAGFLKTLRGRNGGIALARPAGEITVGQVVRASEESFLLAECFDARGSDCPLLNSCEFNRVLKEALDAFFGVLDRTTIADLAGGRPDLRLLLGLEAATAGAPHLS